MSSRLGRARRAAALAAAALALSLAACTTSHPLDRPIRDWLEPGVGPASAPAATPACDDPLGCYGEPVRVGAFDARGMPQASGLAASVRNRHVLYLVDDRPGTREVWAVRADGALLARLAIQGLDAADAESLATGSCGRGSARTCVYVGDIGDNLRSRPFVTVVRFEEPDLSGEPPTGELPAERIQLRYPNGPQDAEALLVDGDGVPHIVTKGRFDQETGSTEPPRLLAAPGFDSGQLVDLGEIPLPAPQRPVASLLYGNVVTGGEYADGRVLLRTYDQLVEYIAPTPHAPLASLAGWTRRSVPVAWQPQPEAVAYAVHRCGYFTVSEQVGDIWFTPCRQ